MRRDIKRVDMTDRQYTNMDAEFRKTRYVDKALADLIDQLAIKQARDEQLLWDQVARALGHESQRDVYALGHRLRIDWANGQMVESEEVDDE